jgi:hypothetical protein
MVSLGYIYSYKRPSFKDNQRQVFHFNKYRVFLFISTDTFFNLKWLLFGLFICKTTTTIKIAGTSLDQPSLSKNRGVSFWGGFRGNFMNIQLQRDIFYTFRTFRSITSRYIYVSQVQTRNGVTRTIQVIRDTMSETKSVEYTYETRVSLRTNIV